MTDQAIRVVPAGWYEDPASRGHVRWWNGLAWTEHTALKPTEQPRPQQSQGFQQHYQAADYQSADQDAVARAAAAFAAQAAETAMRVAEARELERQYGISTAEHDIIVRRAAEATGETPAHNEAGTAYDPNAYGSANWDDEGYDDEPRTATASAWFIALWPILTVIAIGAAAYVAFYVTAEPAIAGIPVVAGLALVPYLFSLIWAATDAHKLRRLGHRPASAAFALLGPFVYLIARRVRVKGVGPLVTFIILTLVAVGAPAGYYFSGSAATVIKSVEIQQTITADLVDGGILGSVSCPLPIPSVALGELFTCDATLPDGSDKAVWVSIDDTEGTFSYAPAVR